MLIVRLSEVEAFKFGIWNLRIEVFFDGAISRYPFQSFILNPKIKGFPLLSGLGHEFSKVKHPKNRNLAPLRLCEINKTVEKPDFAS
ncbi:hypothetical protein DBB36_23070 [Flavobacterium sp. WLB]|nr:hypothetical protein AKO67_22700 [Flavobacterium sp. VMW]OWU88915.1 hypothetical protein APR43_20000 [Flavobacterium sp. NLM]PUU67606.1 hypothetical protein DBB36_23070 [Flavobacterium sp. WLB]